MTDKSNLIETIAKQDKFSTFMRLMGLSGSNELIGTSGTYTVFVPTNDAFSKIPEAKINDLLNEPGQTKLKTLLAYHILPGKVMAASLGSAPSRKALSGEELMFTDINGLKVNNASIQARNLEATNGVIHALDTLLAPTMFPKSLPVATAPTSVGSANLKAVAKTSSSATPVAISARTGSPVLAAVPQSATAVAERANIKSIL